MKLDRKGVIGFPMRLAIAFLILSIFVPITLTMVDDLDDQSQTTIAKQEAERIEDRIKQTYYSGTGSICTVDVQLSGGSYLILGGDGSDAYSMRIMIDDTEKEKVFLQRPSVRLMGGPLYVNGNCTLSLECVSENEIYGIEVSIVD